VLAADKTRLMSPTIRVGRRNLTIHRNKNPIISPIPADSRFKLGRDFKENEGVLTLCHWLITNTIIKTIPAQNPAFEDVPRSSWEV